MEHGPWITEYVLKEALEIAIRIESWIPRKRLLHPIPYKGTELICDSTCVTVKTRFEKKIIYFL